MKRVSELSFSGQNTHETTSNVTKVSESDQKWHLDSKSVFYAAFRNPQPQRQEPAFFLQKVTKVTQK